MKASKVATSTARSIFRLCSPDGQMNDGHMRRCDQQDLLLRSPATIAASFMFFVVLVQAEVASKQVTVESAASLDAETAESLASSLRSQYGQDLTFEFKTNPDLLGGLRIRVGNDVFDGSVKARLDRLANAF